jgi:hypothetical protein
MFSGNFSPVYREKHLFIRSGLGKSASLIRMNFTFAVTSALQIRNQENLVLDKNGPQATSALFVETNMGHHWYLLVLLTRYSVTLYISTNRKYFWMPTIKILMGWPKHVYVNGSPV